MLAVSIRAEAEVVVLPTPSWLDVTIPLACNMPRAFAYSAPRFTPAVVGTQPNGEPVTAMHIDMYSHVGTHIESARHILASGPTLDEYPPDHFVGRGYAVDLSSGGNHCIGAQELAEAAPNVEPDAFVLLRLREAKDDEPATADHPYLSEEAASWLVEQKVRVVGVDTPTPDMDVRRRPHPLDLPVHRILLGAGLLIIENLGGDLRDACGKALTVHAWPLKIYGSDSSPVRVMLRQEL